MISDWKGIETEVVTRVISTR